MNEVVAPSNRRTSFVASAAITICPGRETMCLGRKVCWRQLDLFNKVEKYCWFDSNLVQAALTRVQLSQSVLVCGLLLLLFTVGEGVGMGVCGGGGGEGRGEERGREGGGRGRGSEARGEREGRESVTTLVCSSNLCSTHVPFAVSQLHAWSCPLTNLFPP